MFWTIAWQGKAAAHSLDPPFGGSIVLGAVVQCLFDYCLKENDHENRVCSTQFM